MADPDDVPEEDDDDLASHPHDAFFKESFSDIDHATGFFQEHLPVALAAQIEWKTLELMPGSFVRSSLQQLHSDLLFSVRILGREIMLHLLFEHQTTVDEGMRLRLLGYMNEIWRRHKETQGLPLPPVIPLVLHQGPDRWMVSTHFDDLFELPEPLADLCRPFLPRYEHLLLDLSQYDPAGKEKHAVNRLLLECMKQMRAKGVMGFLIWMSSQDPHELWDMIRRCMLYVCHVDRDLDPETIKTMLPENNVKEEIMTLAQKFKAEGLAEGEARGEARGRLQLLQKIMGRGVSSNEELAALEVTELEGRYEVLQREYETQFKGA